MLYPSKNIIKTIFIEDYIIPIQDNKINKDAI